MESSFFNGDSVQPIRRGAAEQVLADLRGRILSGSLPRGTRLPSEKELASFYAVSSPTVREAIRALSAINLVEIRHGSGTFVVAEATTLMASAMTAVVELEKIDLLSILDLSETLYSQAVSLAVAVASQEDIDELRQVATRFASVTESQDFEETLRTYLTMLVELSGNGLLKAMSGYLIDVHLSLARQAAELAPVAWERIAGNLVGERLAIVDALDARDRVRAMDAVRVYTTRGRELVRENADAMTLNSPEH